MKKTVYFSFAYLLFGLVVGLFYHEAAFYMQALDRYSMLKLVHSHSIVLGTIFLLLVTLLIKVFDLEKYKTLRFFLFSYNIGLVITLGFMTVRGIVQLFSIPINNAVNHMIGGFAGIGHIILSVGFYFLFRTLLSAIKES